MRDNFFKRIASDIWDAGQTVPNYKTHPDNDAVEARIPNVQYMKPFEKWAKDHDRVKERITNLIEDRRKFREYVSKQEQEFNQEAENLESEKNTIEDVLNQLIQSVFPHAELVHRDRPPILDIDFEKQSMTIRDEE